MHGERICRRIKMLEVEIFDGTFDGNNPKLDVKGDFHLLRSVMIQDFDHFSKAQGAQFDNAHPAGRVEEIITKGITVIDGDEWKTVRYSRNE